MKGKDVLMKIAFSFFLMIFSLGACASNHIPLPTADYVDIERYVGKWYAISSLPQTFTKKCKSQTADYKIINAQTISVLNTCVKAKKKTTISGQAVVVNSATNAELEVTFNNFFTRLFRVKGDYTIMKLDEDYRYVLVGSKDRKSLWILARETSMPEATYNRYVEFAKTNNFPIIELKRSEF
jgi:apolipoprotein D and lipocalin family protein